MKCGACGRDGIKYPIFDKRTHDPACPYCLRMNHLHASEGEPEPSIQEAFDFAKGQRWYFDCIGGAADEEETTDRQRSPVHADGHGRD